MSTTPAPTALLFDLDDTLIPEAAPLARAYAAVARAGLRREATAAEVDRVRMSARALWEGECPVPEYARRIHAGPSDGLSSEFPGDGEELAALREFVPSYRARAFDAALPAASAWSGAELRELWWEARMGGQTTFPGAHALLERLRESGRYRMALVTNGTADFQRHKIAVTGVGGYFDAVVVAGDLGVAKPRPEPFLAALDALGASPEEAVMVGNDPARDIEGARALGIRTLWVQPQEGLQPGAITALAQLPGLLGLTASPVAERGP